MKKLITVTFISTLMIACSTVDKRETVKETIYESLPQEVHGGIKKDEIAYGILSVHPYVEGKYQSYIVKQVDETNTEHEFNWAGIFSYPIGGATGLIAGVYGVTACAFGEFETCGDILSGSASLLNPANCELGLAKCKETAGDSYQITEKGDIVSRELLYRNGEVQFEFTGDNGTSLIVPYYKGKVLNVALRELDNPKEILIVPRFYGSMAKFDGKQPSSKIIVPKELIDFNQSIQKRYFQLSTAQSAIASIDRQPLLHAETLTEGVNQIAQENIENYLNVASKPILPTPLVIAEVPKPQTPPRKTVKKDQFETTAEYKARYIKENKEREEHFHQLQVDYRKQVEKRNELVAVDNAYLEEMSAFLIDNYQSRTKKLKQGLEAEKLAQISYAYRNLLGQPQLVNKHYDADSGTFFAKIEGNGAYKNFKYNIKAKIPRETAREIYYSINPNTVIDFTLNNDFGINVKQFTIQHKSESYAATPVDKEYKKKKIELALATIKPDWSGVVQAKPEAIMLPDLQLPQNPNLLDNINSTIQLSRAVTYKDDIPALLKSTPARPINKNRWLIVIGIEKYQNTDNVVYATRSAELFTQVAQKTLGISEQNTLKLINNQATAGAIKDQLRVVLQKVKPGDAVYFYYNGHGIPNPSENNEPYILPSDSIPDFVVEDPSFKLANIYSQFSQSNAASIVAFIDSCFSGSTDGVAINKGVAASRLKPKTVKFDESRMVIVTAGRNTQFSSAYLEKGNRLFSYYVMKSLLQPEYNVKALYKDIYKNVRSQSLSMSGYRTQEPVLQGNKAITL